MDMFSRCSTNVTLEFNCKNRFILNKLSLITSLLINIIVCSNAYIDLFIESLRIRKLKCRS